MRNQLNSSGSVALIIERLHLPALEVSGEPRIVVTDQLPYPSNRRAKSCASLFEVTQLHMLHDTPAEYLPCCRASDKDGVNQPGRRTTTMRTNRRRCLSWRIFCDGASFRTIIQIKSSIGIDPSGDLRT